MFLQPDKIPPMAKKGTLIDYATGDTIILNLSGNNFQPIFADNKGNPMKLEYTIESVIFQNALKNNLNGWLLKPTDSIVPKITILFFHGNGGNITTEYFVATPFVKKGFQVFIFDYSGYGFSQGEATRDNVLIDAVAALDYIRIRSEIKNTKIIIYGQSLGGHLAAVVAQKNESLIDGLVIEAAFSSHRDIAAHESKLGFIARVLVKEGYCAVKSIKCFHKPLLVIHSTEDMTIPFSMGEKLFLNANQPKSFYEIKKCHACGPLFYSDSICEKIKLMLPIDPK